MARKQALNYEIEVLVLNEVTVNHLRELARRAEELRRAVKLQPDPTIDDDVLWSSSLDILGELVNVVEGVVMRQQELLQLTRDGSPYGAVARAGSTEMECPYCQQLVTVSDKAVADGATVCPRCGAQMLLANPT